MYKFDFQLKSTSWSFTTNVTFNQKTTIILSIPNELVRLWWPNGHGDQPLYELVVSNNNQEIGSRFIGFRTVELVQHNYSIGIKGASFYFQINSRPIFVKGSNWIPPDAFQERVSDEKLTQLLTSAQLAGMNMLRVWGGGIYERDSFYEIADRLGIMLWHDFMFACSLYVSLSLFSYTQTTICIKIYLDIQLMMHFYSMFELKYCIKYNVFNLIHLLLSGRVTMKMKVFSQVLHVHYLQQNRRLQETTIENYTYIL